VAIAVAIAVPAGLRLSSAIALIVTVSTEYLAASEIGVGAFIIDVYTTINGMDEVLAGTVSIGFVGYLVNEVLERLGRRLFHWSEALS
jgi:NitT/TauT family transport system permease protein